MKNLKHRDWFSPYISKVQNRLLKVCYVAATRAGLPRLLFLAAAINSTNEANKAGSTCH